MFMVAEAGGRIAPFDLGAMPLHGAPVMAGTPRAFDQLQDIFTTRDEDTICPAAHEYLWQTIVVI
jgi:hypothetical protein